MSDKKYIKSGENVKFTDGKIYLFLGYSDYAKKICVIADWKGNKTTTESFLVSRA